MRVSEIPVIDSIEVRPRDRVLRCGNPLCESHNRIFLVRLMSDGPPFMWPQILCDCGKEPVLVERARLLD